VTPSAADRKSIRRLEKLAEAQAAADAAVVRNLMSTVEGRAWVWRFLGQCHIFSSSFTGEALSSAFREGERNVGQRLLNQVTDTCPDEYIQAMREANVHRALDERRSSPEPDGGDHRSVDEPDAADGGDAPDRDAAEDGGWNLIPNAELRSPAPEAGR
jgi:hypothetical protein